MTTETVYRATFSNHESTPARTRPDPSAAMKNAHKAASYDKWFRAEVQKAIDDPGRNMSHEEVVNTVRGTIMRVRAKRASA